jgi:hypothetical protein
VYDPRTIVEDATSASFGRGFDATRAHRSERCKARSNDTRSPCLKNWICTHQHEQESTRILSTHLAAQYALTRAREPLAIQPQSLESCPEPRSDVIKEPQGLVEDNVGRAHVAREGESKEESKEVEVMVEVGSMVRGCVCRHPQIPTSLLQSVRALLLSTLLSSTKPVRGEAYDAPEIQPLRA